jgi:hypothetical protein
MTTQPFSLRIHDAAFDDECTLRRERTAPAFVASDCMTNPASPNRFRSTEVIGSKLRVAADRSDCDSAYQHNHRLRPGHPDPFFSRPPY